MNIPIKNIFYNFPKKKKKIYIKIKKKIKPINNGHRFIYNNIKYFKITI